MTPVTIAALSAALAVSTIIGYLVTASLAPARLPRFMVWSLAPGIGLGLCSLIYFSFRRAMFTVEFVVLACLLAYRFFYRPEKRSAATPSASLRQPALLLILGVCLGLALGGQLLTIQRAPHGDWDGWAIWNTHARVLYRGTSNWTDSIRYTFHPDYPLLAPSITARFWRYAGKEVPEAGAILGFLLSLSSISLMAAALWDLHGTPDAIPLALMLAGTPTFLVHSVSHLADGPLSFFVLSTIALISLHAHYESESSRLLVLAGFTAGCTGWTKNEGLVFISAASVALMAPVFFDRKRTARSLGSFALGLLPPLAAIIYFKLAIAPQNDLIQGTAFEHVLIRVKDPTRYLEILRHVGRAAWFEKWPIAPMLLVLAFVISRGLNWKAIRSWGWCVGAGAIAITLAGYFLVYLVTPLALEYHLDASLNRLLLHVWPASLLLIGLATKNNQQ